MATAARASTTIAAAYSTGTAAALSRPASTRWNDSTPKVANPVIVRAANAAYAQNAPGSRDTGTCGAATGAGAGATS